MTAVIPPLAAGPELTGYDVLLVNSSAGKDSQAMLSALVARCDSEGVDRARIVVVHADLGRVEWEGTRELAERQAAIYGLRFEVVSRAEDLLDQVVSRRRTLDARAERLQGEAWALHAAGWHRFADIAGRDAGRLWNTPAWPSSTARYCTSDQKTAQVAKLMTRLVAEIDPVRIGRPVRILNCLGIRAQESRDRAKKVALGPDPAGNSKRTVDRWLPLHHWTLQQVWDEIHRSGLPWHPAYDLGMSRLSCAFCVLASKPDLLISARANRDLAAEHAAVERQVRHRFTADLSMAELIAEADLPAQARPAQMALDL